MWIANILAIVSNAATNIGAQISLPDVTFNSIGYVSRSGTAGSYGQFCLKNFEERLQFFIFEKCIGVPVDPHLCQQLGFLFVCFVLFLSFLVFQ